MKHQRCERLLLTSIAIVFLTATGIVTRDALNSDENEVGGTEFQTMVHGLGFGSSLNVDQCEFALDPRLRSVCSHSEGPIPGGTFLCPKHAGSITIYPHLLPNPKTSLDLSEHEASR